MRLPLLWTIEARDPYITCVFYSLMYEYHLLIRKLLRKSNYKTLSVVRKGCVIVFMDLGSLRGFLSSTTEKADKMRKVQSNSNRQKKREDSLVER